MALVATDQSAAFDEAYALSGALVSVGLRSGVRAILPRGAETVRELDGDGVTQAERETEITCLSSELPALTRETKVELEDATWRISAVVEHGELMKTLSLISP